MRLGVLSLFILMLAVICIRPAHAVDGAVIVYGGLASLSEEAFQRILSTDGARYICVQHSLRKEWNSAPAQERAAALKGAGKRVVLQIWWSAGGDFPWSKHSFPNIALDESIRADFFKEVVDRCISGYGAGNLYGVHLMEETGMQFGTDVGPRENPDDFTVTQAPSSAYGAPFYSGYKYPELGGVHIANIRRHEKDFTAMTGLKFADEGKWGPLERYLFDRWVSIRIQSKAQVEFAKYIHAKYPGLKSFTWDLINAQGENPRTDHWQEARYFDGVITDPYSDVAYNFQFERAFRTIYPGAEIINFSMGGMANSKDWPYASDDRKRALATGAYLGGVNVVGFFQTPMDYTRPESWKMDTGILDSMKTLPVFKKKSDLLLISDATARVSGSQLAWSSLKYFDFLPTWEAHGVDFNRYKVVILHSGGGDSLMYWDSGAMMKKYGLPGYVDYRKLDEFVSRGGILILSGLTRMREECPLFLSREGYLHTLDAPLIEQRPLAVSPEGWLKDKAGVSRDYQFSARRIPVSCDRQKVVETKAGYFVKYGKGAAFFFPYLRLPAPKEPAVSDEWSDYRSLLADVTRGVLGLAGRRDIANEYISGPAEGDYCLQAVSDDGRHSACVLRDVVPESAHLALPEGSVGQQLRRQVKGMDIFSQTKDPALSIEKTAAILVNR
jgi:hypothetical protein